MPNPPAPPPNGGFDGRAGWAARQRGDMYVSRHLQRADQEFTPNGERRLQLRPGLGDERGPPTRSTTRGSSASTRDGDLVVANTDSGHGRSPGTSARALPRVDWSSTAGGLADPTGWPARPTAPSTWPTATARTWSPSAARAPSSAPWAAPTTSASPRGSGWTATARSGWTPTRPGTSTTSSRSRRRRRDRPLQRQQLDPYRRGVRHRRGLRLPLRGPLQRQRGGTVHTAPGPWWGPSGALTKVGRSAPRQGPASGPRASSTWSRRTPTGEPWTAALTRSVRVVGSPWLGTAERGGPGPRRLARIACHGLQLTSVSLPGSPTRSESSYGDDHRRVTARHQSAGRINRPPTGAKAHAPTPPPAHLRLDRRAAAAVAISSSGTTAPRRLPAGLQAGHRRTVGCRLGGAAVSRTAPSGRPRPERQRPRRSSPASTKNWMTPAARLEPRL